MSVHIDVITLVIPLEKVLSAVGLHKMMGIIQDLEFGNHYDDYLLRFAAMNPMDIYLIIGQWEDLGLRPFGRKRGKKIWKEMCVVDRFSGPTLPCEWLVFEADEPTVEFNPVHRAKARA